MPSTRPLVQIFARSLNAVIGDGETNSIPFKSTVDLKAFKRYTVGNIVIMGRKTAASLNFKPLPNRINVIMSHELCGSTIPGFLVYNDKDKLLEDINNPEIFDLTPYKDYRNTEEEIAYVIGGAVVYNLFEEHISASVVTLIDKDVTNLSLPIKHQVEKASYYEYVRALPLDIEGDDKIRDHRIHYHTCHKHPESLLNVYPEANELSDYIKLVQDILDNGESKEDRTSTGTRSVFGRMLHFKNVNSRPPFLTNRKLPLKSTIGELLWFISGNTNAFVLKDIFKCNFWDEWANDFGSIGPMYGAQWRGKTDGIDQLSKLLNDMVHNPSSRRLMVDAWNPRVLPEDGVVPNKQADQGLSALAPCHFAFQVNVTSDFKVDLQWYQRSADVLLGLPVNIASYYILLCILCKAATELTDGEVIYIPRNLTVALGDAHIYNNHIELAEDVVTRRPLKGAKFEVPDGVLELFFKDVKIQTLADYQQKLFDNIVEYSAHPNPKIPRNV